MKYPDFFNTISPIILKDDLAKFLGSSQDGIIEISYLEIVKMAGHSCGVTSGTYIMAQKGLKALYGNDFPKRGEIKVELQKNLEEGNTGVFGSVMSNITGATTNMGFGGIQGKFNRRNLMFFGADIPSDIRLTRLDTGKSVDLYYTPGKVVNPRDILMSAIGPNSTEESKKTFPVRWQEMVKTIFNNADKVVMVKE